MQIMIFSIIFKSKFSLLLINKISEIMKESAPTVVACMGESLEYRKERGAKVLGNHSAKIEDLLVADMMQPMTR